MSDPKAEPATAIVAGTGAVRRDRPGDELDLAAARGRAAERVSTELAGDRVRCVIEEGTAEDGDDRRSTAVPRSRAPTATRRPPPWRGSRAAASRLIAKRDAKTGVATPTFILERQRFKNEV